MMMIYDDDARQHTKTRLNARRRHT